MTRLIIARHGNTFEKGQTPTRVGARTDLPLVEKGISQAKALGMHLKQKSMIPELVFTSKLSRTIDTAKYALAVMACDVKPEAMDMFNEIDYGPDENKTEEDIIKRIGEDAITAWDKAAIVPPGWQADTNGITRAWREFAAKIVAAYRHSTVLIVTSNGIARFAPYITSDYKAFADQYDIKLSTGAFGILEYNGFDWDILDWNVKPADAIKTA